MILNIQHSAIDCAFFFLQTDKYVPFNPTDLKVRLNLLIIESVDSICMDSTDTQYMLIQTNFSKI